MTEQEEQRFLQAIEKKNGAIASAKLWRGIALLLFLLLLFILADTKLKWF